MYGLSPAGFKRKRFNDIVESMNENARDLFGEGISLTERSPMGMFIRVIAFAVAKLWELAENVYNSAFIDSAEGAHMDRVAGNMALRRRPAAPSQGEITVNGLNGAVIPQGFRVKTSGDIVFETTKSGSITEGNTVTLPIECLDTGKKTNVSAGSITTIVNPLAGIAGVTNLEETTRGANLETDAEFRARYDAYVNSSTSSTREAIESALLGTLGVHLALVRVNESLNVQNNIPGKSISPLVFGGEDIEIAKAILRTKAHGIRSWGTTVVGAPDSLGNLHTIGFSRPLIARIQMEITLDVSADYEPENEMSIKRALLKYIGGWGEDDVFHNGLGIGSTLVYTRLISLIHTGDSDSLKGIDGVSVQYRTFGTSTWKQENTTYGATQIPQIVNLSDIVITTQVN